VFVAGFGLVVASVLDDVSAGLTIEVVDGVGAVPDPLIVLVILAAQLLAWLVPALGAATLLWRRTYRRLALVTLAALVAGAVAWGLELTVLDHLDVTVVAVDEHHDREVGPAQIELGVQESDAQLGDTCVEGVGIDASAGLGGGEHGVPLFTLPCASSRLSLRS